MSAVATTMLAFELAMGMELAHAPTVLAVMVITPADGVAVIRGFLLSAAASEVAAELTVGPAAQSAPHLSWKPGIRIYAPAIPEVDVIVMVSEAAAVDRWTIDPTVRTPSAGAPSVKFLLGMVAEEYVACALRELTPSCWRSKVQDVSTACLVKVLAVVTAIPRRGMRAKATARINFFIFLFLLG
jgi:hypothetical protein